MTDEPPFKVRDHILPGNATPLERAIADTDGRLDDIDTDLVRRVGGPDIAEVPAPFLSRRAWGRSVDVWDPTWPEGVQRAVIEAAPIVHARKGTLFAVRTALDALRISTHIVQWWETTPRGEPYTFKVTAYARDKIYDGAVILDPRLVKVAFATVMRTKPLSRAFDFSVGAGFTGSLGLAGISVAKSQHRAVVRAPARIEARQILGLAGIGVARHHHRAVVNLSFIP